MSAWNQGFVMTVAVALMALVAACSTDKEADSDARLSCFVSVPPQAYLLERVGGEHIGIHILVGPGHSPATYEPTAKQFAQLAESRVYFAIGVPFEKAVLPRVKRGFPTLEIIHTQKGVSVDGADPHIWLNPLMAKIIARNIRDALIGIDPAHQDAYERNYETLSVEMDELDRELAAKLAPYRGRELFVFHPAYAYLLEAYGLSQVAIEADGMTPGSRHLTAVIERALQQRVKALFVQPQFSQVGAQTIADEIGARLVVLDPLARDYPDNMRHMSEQIRVTMQ